MLQVAGQLVQAGAARPHRLDHAQRRQQAIARRGVVVKNDVARLLSAQHRARPHHCLQNVLVAHRRTEHPNAVLGQRPFQAEVRHHRSDYRGPPFRPGQLTAPQQEARRQQHDSIAIDYLAAAGHEYGPVGIPVQSHAHVGAQLGHCLAKPIHVQSPAAQVDVPAVRRTADSVHPRPQSLQQRRRQPRRRAVRAVHYQAQPPQRMRVCRRQRVQVTLVQPRVPFQVDRSRLHPGRQQREDLRLQFVLPLVSQLVA